MDFCAFFSLFMLRCSHGVDVGWGMELWLRCSVLLSLHPWLIASFPLLAPLGFCAVINDLWD